MKTIVSCHCEFGHSKKLKRIFDNKSFEGYYYGIKNLVELSEKYNVKLSLFLMPCFLTLEKDMKNNIIDLLLHIKDKHELGLHIHPEDSFLIKNKASDGKYKGLRSYNFEEQKKMIKFGKEALEKVLNTKITSFVSGRWSENNDTIQALLDLKFKHDNSPNRFKSSCCNWTKLGRFRTPYQPDKKDYQKIGSEKIILVPCSKVITNASSSPESIEVLNANFLLNNIREYYYLNNPYFHIVLHSVSMTDLNGETTQYYETLDKMFFLLSKLEKNKFIKTKEVVAENKEYDFSLLKKSLFYKNNILDLVKLGVKKIC